MPVFKLLVDLELLESYDNPLPQIFKKIEETPAIRAAYLEALRPRREEYQNHPQGYQIDEEELIGIGSMTSYELGFSFRLTWLCGTSDVLFEVIDGQPETDEELKASSLRLN